MQCEGWISNFQEKSITLLVFRGGGWEGAVKFPVKKRYIKLE